MEIRDAEEHEGGGAGGVDGPTRPRGDPVGKERDRDDAEKPNQQDGIAPGGQSRARAKNREDQGQNGQNQRPRPQADGQDQADIDRDEKRGERNGGDPFGSELQGNPVPVWTWIGRDFFFLGSPLDGRNLAQPACAHSAKISVWNAANPAERTGSADLRFGCAPT